MSFYFNLSFCNETCAYHRQPKSHPSSIAIGKYIQLRDLQTRRSMQQLSLTTVVDGTLDARACTREWTDLLPGPK